MKQSLVLVVIAAAETHPPCMPPDLGRLNKNRSRAVVSVVCRRSCTVWVAPENRREALNFANLMF